MALIPFRNRAGKLAVQIDGDGELILHNGMRMSEDHPAWVESEEDPASLDDLAPKQREVVEGILSAEEKAEAARVARLAEQEKQAAASYLQAVLRYGSRSAANKYPKGQRAFERIATEDEQEAVTIQGQAIQAERDRRQMAAFDRSLVRILNELETLVGIR